MPLTGLNPLRQLREARFAVKFTVIVATLSLAATGTLLAVLLALTVSSGLRAFVGGEGLWSKGQKDSVYFITRYLQTRDLRDYEAFQQALSVPLGDRLARLELLKPKFDPAIAETGFVIGGNARHDVPAMIFLVRHFGWIDFVAEAVRIWGEAEPQLLNLQATAAEIRSAADSGPFGMAQQNAFLQRIDLINAAVTPLENRFSEILGNGARTVQTLLVLTVGAIAALLLGGGLALVWVIGRDLRDSIEALRDGAQRIARGDLDHQLVPRGRDELAQLTVAFNDMVGRRREAEVGLKNANQLYARVMEHSTNAIYTMDREGRFVSANRRTCEITGYALDELIGLPWAQLVDPDHLPDLYPKFAATIAGGQPILNYEVPLIQPGGNQVQITFSIAALRHDDAIVGVVGAAEDITDRKRSEVELLRSNRELEHFAYVVSHDLQEPLTTAGGFSRLLKQRYRPLLGEEGAQWIDYIVDGCTGMQRLIEDLLAYATVSRTASGLEPTPLADAVQQALAQLKGTLDAVGATVEIGPLPTVQAFPRQMAQLFQNLIGNAAKFRSQAPLRVVVTAQAADDGNGWIIRIRDNGIGIPEESRQDVFGLFHRLQRRDRQSGNGIGLTICKRIVELHHGEIWIEDGEPGTVFGILLGRGEKPAASGK